MITYIAILRAINVSGKNIIKMTALKSALEKSGYKKVTTYIQSGNIIFQTSQQKEAIIAADISNIIEEHFNLKVPVIVLTIDTLQSAVDNNPFISHADVETGNLHIVFLDAPPFNYSTEKIDIKKQDNEKYIIGENLVYLNIPKYGNSKLSNQLFETVLKVTATTRNWNTSNKILSIANQL